VEHLGEHIEQDVPRRASEPINIKYLFRSPIFSAIDRLFAARSLRAAKAAKNLTEPFLDMSR